MRLRYKKPPMAALEYLDSLKAKGLVKTAALLSSTLADSEGTTCEEKPHFSGLPVFETTSRSLGLPKLKCTKD